MNSHHCLVWAVGQDGWVGRQGNLLMNLQHFIAKCIDATLSNYHRIKDLNLNVNAKPFYPLKVFATAGKL